MFGQTDTKTYSLDLNLALSKRFHRLGNGQFQTNPNIFIKKQFGNSSAINFVFGVGVSFLNGGGNNTSISSCSDTLTTNTLEKLTYILATSGIRYTKNNFFILGEIGYGLNLHSSLQREITDVKFNPDPNKRDRIYISGVVSPNTSNVYPVMVTIGWDINFGKIPLIVGLKSFKSIRILNSTTNYFGVGFVLGVRI